VRNRSAYLAYIYLLRIPILTWMILVSLVALALTGSPLVRGLFDLTPSEPATGLLFLRFWVLAFAATLASAAMAVTAWLTLVWGEERFAAGPTHRHGYLRATLTVLALLPAASVFGGAWFITAT
jgi:hypothetical protein